MFNTDKLRLHSMTMTEVYNISIFSSRAFKGTTMQAGDECQPVVYREIEQILTSTGELVAAVWCTDALYASSSNSLKEISFICTANRQRVRSP